MLSEAFDSAVDQVNRTFDRAGSFVDKSVDNILDNFTWTAAQQRKMTRELNNALDSVNPAKQLMPYIIKDVGDVVKSVPETLKQNEPEPKLYGYDLYDPEDVKDDEPVFDKLSSEYDYSDMKY